MRQEMLASARLQYLKRKLMKVPDVGERLKDVSQVKNLGPVDSWIEVTKLLEKKHSAEREVRNTIYARYETCSHLALKLSSFLLC